VTAPSEDGAISQHKKRSAEKTIHAPYPSDYGIRGHAFHDLNPPYPPRSRDPVSSNEVPSVMRTGMRDDPSTVDGWVGLSPEARAKSAARTMGLLASECGRCLKWYVYSHGPDPYICIHCREGQPPPWIT
jgi:hypothetical protein